MPVPPAPRPGGGSARPSTGNPKPGRESTTTLKASEDAVPCANGSVSSGSSFQYSRNKLGQPAGQVTLITAGQH